MGVVGAEREGKWVWWVLGGKGSGCGGCWKGREVGVVGAGGREVGVVCAGGKGSGCGGCWEEEGSGCGGCWRKREVGVVGAEREGKWVWWVLEEEGSGCGGCLEGREVCVVGAEREGELLLRRRTGVYLREEKVRWG